MRIIVSVAITADGYLDDAKPGRLVISNSGDWAEVHALRALSDAILVGAETVRRDNPALVIRDEAVRALRVRQGLNPNLTKVVVSGSGNLDPASRFFTEGGGNVRKIVITGGKACRESIESLRQVAGIVELDEINASNICRHLESEGINTLMVEGGAKILKMFLGEGCADILRIAQSGNLTVADDTAPRMPWYCDYPFEGSALVKDIRSLGDMSVSTYIFDRDGGSVAEDCEGSSERNIGYAQKILAKSGYANNPALDIRYLKRAVELSRNSPLSDTAYSVGCVIRTLSGDIFEGYSRETSPLNHAEEEALIKAKAAEANLEGATLYSSMEPCSVRSSKPVSCSEHIIREKIKRVVYAYPEPGHFVCCEGASMLRQAGTDVCVIPCLGHMVEGINSHILK